MPDSESDIDVIPEEEPLNNIAINLNDLLDASTMDSDLSAGNLVINESCVSESESIEKVDTAINTTSKAIDIDVSQSSEHSENLNLSESEQPKPKLTARKSCSYDNKKGKLRDGKSYNIMKHKTIKVGIDAMKPDNINEGDQHVPKRRVWDFLQKNIAPTSVPKKDIKQKLDNELKSPTRKRKLTDSDDSEIEGRRRSEPAAKVKKEQSQKRKTSSSSDTEQDKKKKTVKKKYLDNYVLSKLSKDAFIEKYKHKINAPTLNSWITSYEMMNTTSQKQSTLTSSGSSSTTTNSSSTNTSSSSATSTSMPKNLDEDMQRYRKVYRICVELRKEFGKHYLITRSKDNLKCFMKCKMCNQKFIAKKQVLATHIKQCKGIGALGIDIFRDSYQQGAGALRVPKQKSVLKIVNDKTGEKPNKQAKPDSNLSFSHVPSTPHTPHPTTQRSPLFSTQRSSSTSPRKSKKPAKRAFLSDSSSDEKEAHSAAGDITEDKHVIELKIIKELQERDLLVRERKCVDCGDVMELKRRRGCRDSWGWICDLCNTKANLRVNSPAHWTQMSIAKYKILCDFFDSGTSVEKSSELLPLVSSNEISTVFAGLTKRRKSPKKLEKIIHSPPPPDETRLPPGPTFHGMEHSPNIPVPEKSIPVSIPAKSSPVSVPPKSNQDSVSVKSYPVSDSAKSVLTKPNPDLVSAKSNPGSILTKSKPASVSTKSSQASVSAKSTLASALTKSKSDSVSAQPNHGSLPAKSNPTSVPIQLTPGAVLKKSNQTSVSTKCSQAGVSKKSTPVYVPTKSMSDYVSTKSNPVSVPTKSNPASVSTKSNQTFVSAKSTSAYVITKSKSDSVSEKSDSFPAKSNPTSSPVKSPHASVQLESNPTSVSTKSSQAFVSTKSKLDSVTGKSNPDSLPENSNPTSVPEKSSSLSVSEKSDQVPIPENSNPVHAPEKSTQLMGTENNTPISEPEHSLLIPDAEKFVPDKDAAKSTSPVIVDTGNLTPVINTEVSTPVSPLLSRPAQEILDSNPSEYSIPTFDITETPSSPLEASNPCSSTTGKLETTSASPSCAEEVTSTTSSNKPVEPGLLKIKQERFDDDILKEDPSGRLCNIEQCTEVALKDKPLCLKHNCKMGIKNVLLKFNFGSGGKKKKDIPADKFFVKMPPIKTSPDSSPKRTRNLSEDTLILEDDEEIVDSPSQPEISSSTPENDDDILYVSPDFGDFQPISSNEPNAIKEEMEDCSPVRTSAFQAMFASPDSSERLGSKSPPHMLPTNKSPEKLNKTSTSNFSSSKSPSQPYSSIKSPDNRQNYNKPRSQAESLMSTRFPQSTPQTPSLSPRANKRPNPNMPSHGTSSSSTTPHQLFLRCESAPSGFPSPGASYPNIPNLLSRRASSHHTRNPGQSHKRSSRGSSQSPPSASQSHSGPKRLHYFRNCQLSSFRLNRDNPIDKRMEEKIRAALDEMRTKKILQIFHDNIKKQSFYNTNCGVLESEFLFMTALYTYVNVLENRFTSLPSESKQSMSKNLNQMLKMLDIFTLLRLHSLCLTYSATTSLTRLCYVIGQSVVNSRPSLTAGDRNKVLELVTSTHRLLKTCDLFKCRAEAHSYDELTMVLSVETILDERFNSYDTAGKVKLISKYLEHLGTLTKDISWPKPRVLKVNGLDCKLRNIIYENYRTFTSPPPGLSPHSVIENWVNSYLKYKESPRQANTVVLNTGSIPGRSVPASHLLQEGELNTNEYFVDDHSTLNHKICVTCQESVLDSANNIAQHLMLHINKPVPQGVVDQEEVSSSSTATKPASSTTTTQTDPSMLQDPEIDDSFLQYDLKLMRLDDFYLLDILQEVQKLENINDRSISDVHDSIEKLENKLSKKKIRLNVDMERKERIKEKRKKIHAEYETLKNELKKQI